MKLKILLPLAGLALAPAASAVILTFDADLEGAVAQDDAVSLAHSPFSGGTMALTVDGGWAGNSIQVPLLANPAIAPVLQNAALNGGSLSFDLLIDTTASEGSLVGATGPGWLQPVVIANSTNAGAGGVGGWDQNIMGSDNLAAGSIPWPTVNGVESISVSLPIIPTAGGVVADDGQLLFDTTGWSELHMGINSEGAAFSGPFTVYIDNLEITSIPEPSTALLALVGMMGIFRRRR